jgi:hypothetical protein
VYVPYENAYLRLCFGLLLVLAAIPSKLHADSFCSEGPPFQYQACGTVAAGNTFTVNSTGTSIGVFGVFQGFHADFADSVHAELWRGSNLIATSSESLTNKQLAVDQTIPFFTNTQVLVGDIIQLVFTDQGDPNGPWTFYSRDYASKNPDGLNHVWAIPLTLASNNCAPGQNTDCVFVGMEDLPLPEPSDFDYNDFRMWFYGVTLSPGASEVPEPSSILLLSAAPVAFAFRKLRNFF